MTTPHFVRPAHHPLPMGHRLDGIGHDAARTPSPRRSTAPAGLFAQAPEVVREKVARVRPKREPKPRKVAPCGTEIAAKRHARNGEVDATGRLLCDECRAGRDARRTKPRRIPTMTLEPGARCGSRQGYDDHLVRKEGTCQPCRDSVNADARKRYVRRTADVAKAPKLPPTVGPKCGSEAGRSWHRRRNQEPCVACKQAVNSAAREVRAA